MDAIEYMNQLKKICIQYVNGAGCSACPLNQYDVCLSPCDMSSDDIKLSVELVRRWSEKQTE